MTLSGGGSRRSFSRSPARFPRVLPSKPSLDPRAFVLIVWAGLAACAAAAPEPAPVVAIPGDTPAVIAVNDATQGEATSSSRPRPLVWETDEPRARARAAREGLPLLVFLSADWSAASIAMTREVWSDPRVLVQRTPIVALRLDLSADTPDTELRFARYGLRTLPATIVFDAEGHEVARLSGLCTVDEVLAAIRRAAGDP
ncbi:thioredoxin family protein [Polyangium sp. y55x31]|uniref:thioredoxin family protein n=1 Tax=Polyangium sp. y55x31 TaxID=3042688 RepID=UPI0024821DDC|nr:thioredoxin family protein [Polyangium sp. y55x31]MDI1484412.1 thioredoxin family protein [Polyangium sp. y55x31]